MTFTLFILLGLALGVIGTLVGAGGGFLLVPILLFMYPHDEPETITCISLTVIACNAISGSISYGRRRKIDVRAALWFALTAIPGSVLGVVVASHLPKSVFQLILGCVLASVAIYLLTRRKLAGNSRDDPAAQIASAMGPSIPHSRARGLLLAFLVGFISSLLGLGGGIIHVPLLVHVLGFPVHIATATSHLVLAITSSGGVLTHIVAGDFHAGLDRAVPISIGVVIGAQLGAALAPKVPAAIIMKVLAVALLLVGLRVVVLGYSTWSW